MCVYYIHTCLNGSFSWEVGRLVNMAFIGQTVDKKLRLNIQPTSTNTNINRFPNELPFPIQPISQEFTPNWIWFNVIVFPNVYRTSFPS